MSKSSLILVRHGQSEWNKQNKFTGWVDVPLSGNGKKEAKEAGHKINNLQLDFDNSFSSILERSIQTYDQINKICEFNLVLKKDWRLNERHYGNLQGLNKQEMRNIHGDEQVLVWRRSYDVKPPEISSESHDLLAKQDCFKDLKINPFPKHESLKDTFYRLIPFLNENLIPLIEQNKNLPIWGHKGIQANLDRFGGEVAPRVSRGLAHQFATSMPQEGPDGIVNLGLGNFFINFSSGTPVTIKRNKDKCQGRYDQSKRH